MHFTRRAGASKCQRSLSTVPATQQWHARGTTGRTTVPTSSATNSSVYRTNRPDRSCLLPKNAWICSRLRGGGGFGPVEGEQNTQPAGVSAVRLGAPAAGRNLCGMPVCGPDAQPEGATRSAPETATGVEHRADAHVRVADFRVDRVCDRHLACRQARSRRPHQGSRLRALLCARANRERSLREGALQLRTTSHANGPTGARVSEPFSAGVWAAGCDALRTARALAVHDCGRLLAGCDRHHLRHLLLCDLAHASRAASLSLGELRRLCRVPAFLLARRVRSHHRPASRVLHRGVLCISREARARRRISPRVAVPAARARIDIAVRVFLKQR